MAGQEKKLIRLPDQGIISGVAAGFADYFEMDVTMMRLLFVLFTLVSGGTIIVAYIVLALVMPTPDGIKTAAADVGERLNSFVDEIKTSGRTERASNLFGVGLILFGLWVLVGQFFPDWMKFQWRLLWPSLIVLFGVWMIMRSKKS